MYFFYFLIFEIFGEKKMGMTSLKSDKMFHVEKKHYCAFNLNLNYDRM